MPFIRMAVVSHEAKKLQDDLWVTKIGTSMCFASPFSTPPNALVMPAGKYSFVDYLKVGVPLQVIMGIVMVIVLPLLFPMQG